jgi:hypothetical protein
MGWKTSRGSSGSSSTACIAAGQPPAGAEVSSTAVSGCTSTSDARVPRVLLEMVVSTPRPASAAERPR